MVFPACPGSLQRCPDIPDDLKAIYRTAWDIDPADLIDMAADRAPFIDQSQSLTLGIRRPTPDLMVSLRPSFFLPSRAVCIVVPAHCLCRRILCCVRGEPV